MKSAIGRYFLVFVTLVVAGLMGGCNKSTVETPVGSVIARSGSNGVTAILSNSNGYLSEGQNEFTLELRNDQGGAVEAGAITLYFDMPAMGSMPHMKNEAALTTTNRPGVYRGTVAIEMKGTWQTKLSYEGPGGGNQFTFAVNVR